MKRLSLLTIGGVLLASFLASASASAISLDFSNESGSLAQFGAGGSLVFADEVPNSFNDIGITGSDGVGDAIGLKGDIDGIFTIGMITSPMPGVEIASILGTGLLVIDDGAGYLLSGILSFESISTFLNFGGINIAAAVNLTGITYTGSNSDLLAMAATSNGTVQASFTAPIDMSLSDLVANGVALGNYSGTIGSTEPIPEPSAALTFAVGSLVVGGMLRRRS